MSRMFDSEAEKFLGRKAPPLDDSWRPHHKAHKKPYGLTVYTPSGAWMRRRTGKEFWEFTTWYASERDRDNAIVAANKHAEFGKYSIPVALAKVSR